MKQFRNYIILLLTLFLFSCSKSQELSQDEAGLSTVNNASLEERAMTNDEIAKENGLGGEKGITTINLDYETIYFDEANQHVIETIKEVDAYIEYSNQSSYSPGAIIGGEARQYRRIDFTIRVAKEQVTVLLESLEGMEAVKIGEQIGSEDVTQTYRDTETRINVLNQKEKRLNELMEEAETIDQILQIEDNLSQTIAEREILQSQLDGIDNLIDYTTVHLHLVERQRVSNGRNETLPFWGRAKEAVLDSLYSFYYWVQDAAIWIIYALPFIVIIVVVAILIRYGRKVILEKRKKD